MSRKVLLTSVCRPLGPKHGDGTSVGYELLHSQVTRAQGLFSPRAVHLQFSLDYIAENLDTPTVVLQYPSKSEFIRELKKGYDFVGICFIMSLMHKMKDMVALIRQYSPSSKIVLGGYGTMLPDEAIAPYADHICRGEGVAFMRHLLGEPELPMPYKHPMIVSELKVFSNKVSNTGMVFAGLGCPNGCDFCCTSHYFDRKHIKLLPEGKDIYAVMERYMVIDPDMAFTIIDEDFLLNKKRAMEFHDCVVKGGKALSIFAFGSIKAISQYTIEELLEMGIDGFWIGYEGTRSGYPKQQGRAVDELFNELREHGITVLASMIVGFDYQDKNVVAKELEGLVKLKPALAQFMIYGPVPGTPFFKRVVKDNLLQDAYAKDMDLFYRRADGFRTMIKHPTLSPEEVEGLQRWCFEEDYQRLGASIFRVLDVRLAGYQRLKNSINPLIRKKAQVYATDLRAAYPVFLAGKLLGPNAEIRRWTADLERRLHAELGQPTLAEKCMSVVAVGAALWTGLTLKFDMFQHPALTRKAYRLPGALRNAFDIWGKFHGDTIIPDLSIEVEHHAQEHVLMRLDGPLSPAGAEGLGQRISDSMAKCKNHLILDLQNLQWDKTSSLAAFAEKLSAYRSRISLILPKLTATHPEIILLASMFQLYKG